MFTRLSYHSQWLVVWTFPQTVVYEPAKLEIQIGCPDSKVMGRFKNFESPRLPRLPSYHKQHSLFNDKFQSFSIATGIYIEFN